MKTYKKRHQKLLHYCLTQRLLCPISFSVLTNLTDKDSQRCLSSNLGEVRKVVATLGLLIEYQKHRQNREGWSLVQVRKLLGQNLYLWSDAVGIQHIPQELSNQQLGLMMLAQYDNRLAVVWSIRLRVDLPSQPLTITSTYRLCDVVSQVLAPLFDKPEVD
ncbi:hypothetical protein JHW46_01660 [Vibrio splendidus]|nr:hypothetical protein [Vibrio splendidus]